MIPCAFLCGAERILTVRIQLTTLAAALMFVLSSATVTFAAEPSLNAVSFEDVPRGVPLTVEIFDNSDENLALKRAFEDELRAQGYEVQNGANLIMSLETRDSSGRWTGGGSNRVVRIGNSDNHTGTDAPDVRVSIFDNERGGILNPKRGSTLTQVAPNQYRIDTSIEDRLNGRTLWQGWAVQDVQAIDDLAGHRMLVKPLVSSIGKTVRSGEPGPN